MKQINSFWFYSVIILSWLVSIPAIGGGNEYIDGAFGVRLGESFQKDHYQLIESSKTLRGNKYIIKAPKGSGCFNKASVFATEISNTVYWVKSKCVLSNKNNSNQAYNMIVLLLDDKYGSYKKKKVKPGKYGVIDENMDRYVRLSTIGNNIYISYGSKLADKVASEEKYKIKLDKAKKDGESMDSDLF